MGLTLRFGLPLWGLNTMLAPNLRIVFVVQWIGGKPTCSGLYRDSVLTVLGLSPLPSPCYLVLLGPWQKDGIGSAVDLVVVEGLRRRAALKQKGRHLFG